MGMRFKTSDMHKLIKACEYYKEQTGSEYMWEQYDDLIQKLTYYIEEYCPVEESGIANKKS